LETCRRIKGLVDYISGRYGKAAEIGIGHSPDVAYSLIDRQLDILATDILPFEYSGLNVVVDDVTAPDTDIYINVNVLYSMRPPSELVPYMVRLAAKLSADLIVKPLSSEYLNGKLTKWGDTTFFLWKYRTIEKVSEHEKKRFNKEICTG
jgi:uncharacterized protein